MKIFFRSAFVLCGCRGPYCKSQYPDCRAARVAENLPPFGNKLQRLETSVPGTEKYLQFPVSAGCSQHLPIEGRILRTLPTHPFRPCSVEHTFHLKTHPTFPGKPSPQHHFPPS